jgi:signal transduction histidine kinase
LIRDLHRRRFIAGLTALATAPLLPARDGLAAATPLRQVRLRLKWLHQFQFAGFYMAKERGLYAAAGLDVDILEGGPSVDPASSVLAGEAEFGVGNSSLLLERAAGSPVTVLGVIFQHSPFVLVARRDTGIDSVHDLAGKTLMLETHAAELLAYLSLERVPLDSLKILPHAADVHVLSRPGVDAISAYTTSEPYDLHKAGIPYQVLNPRASGIDFYGDALFTTQRLAERERDLALAFRNASMAGWRLALAEPTAAIDVILGRYAPGMDRERLVFEANEIRRLMLADMVDVGYMHEGRWHHIADGFAAAGLIPKDFPLDGFLFDPVVRRGPTWLYWVAGGSTGAALAVTGVLARFHALTTRLRREVALRAAAEEASVRAKNAAEEAARAKSRFLAGMSHEFRTPLNTIMGLSTLIREQKGQPIGAAEMRDYGNLIHTGAEHLLRLVEDLLDLSKIEAGKMEIRPEPTDLARRVDATLALIRTQANAKGLRLRAKVAPEARACVVDERALGHILLNLLANAVKFTETGEVAVSVSRASDGAILIVVRDTGVGIAQGDIERLFTPFERADNAYAAARGGSGLGLALVKSLTELHGGTVQVSSGAGRGTTVTVRLPQPAGGCAASLAAGQAIA